MTRKHLLMSVLMTIVGLVLATRGITAEENKPPFPTYGSGAIDVRIYSDYFCPPCRQLEPRLEPILKNLLKQNTVRLTLVEFPMHKESLLYSRYFLYALKSKNEAEHALHVRGILYEAAGGKDFLTAKKLEELFRGKNIAFKPFDTKPVFEQYKTMITEDGVDSTPTCIIIRAVIREKYLGGPNVFKVLQELK